MHADPRHECSHQLEAPAEARAMQRVRRGCGDYAETTNEVAVEDGGDRGVQLGGADTADSHASEHGRKRIQPSASDNDADTSSW